MRLSELDDIEKEVLLGVVIERARADLNDGRPLTEMSQPRPGERILEFWCSDCDEWHEASVLGGRVGECGGSNGNK